MRTPNSFTRRPMIAASALVAAACLLPAGGALANDISTPAPVVATMNAPEAATLTATPWETTGATNQDGTPVALDNPAVSNFVGYAYYNPNGTFTMYNLDDTPKMQGDWTVDNTDGNLTRTLVAKDAEGNILFTRVVPITVLNANEFTYRVYPDAANTAVYYDIIHTPTTHTEPGSVAPATLLSATPWETTGATNQDGTPVALDNPAVSNFVGYAYYNPNGTFTMYNLDDTPKMQGDWTVDNTDGNLTRTLVAKDAEGNVLFTRVVPITVLNANEFTYRVYPDAANTAVYYDIIHTPTTHTEPVAVPGENTDGSEENNGNNTETNGSGVNEQENASQKDSTGTAGDLAVTGTDSLGLLWGGLASLMGGAALITRRLIRMTNNIG